MASGGLSMERFEEFDIVSFRCEAKKQAGNRESSGGSPIRATNSGIIRTSRREVQMRFTRRECLKTLSVGVAAGYAKSLAFAARSESNAGTSKLAIPGPFRGRVVAVENPAVLASGQYQAEAVRQMMRRGMTELTGAGDWPDAWRRFFEPGDVG